MGLRKCNASGIRTWHAFVIDFLVGLVKMLDWIQGRSRLLYAEVMRNNVVVLYLRVQFL